MQRFEDMNDTDAMETLFDDLMSHYRGAMPAIVKKVETKQDGTLSTLSVQPAINYIVANELTIDYQNVPIITDVPFCIPYSQTLGLGLTIPIQNGDDVLIVCPDRSIDNWQEFGGQQNPVEPISARMYDLNDAIAIPGILRDATGFKDYSLTNIEIRDKGRDTFVSLDSNKTITLKSSNNEIEINDTVIDVVVDKTKIELQNSSLDIFVNNVEVANFTDTLITFKVPIQMDDTLMVDGKITSSSGMTITGNVDMTGTLDVTGNIELNGEDVTVISHHHIDSQGGPTGPAIP